MGKELANTVYRLKRQREQLVSQEILGKSTGLSATTMHTGCLPAN
jgi:adenylosuccinate lyase